VIDDRLDVLATYVDGHELHRIQRPAVTESATPR
jgi:hypothetical protein